MLVLASFASCGLVLVVTVLCNLKRTRSPKVLISLSLVANLAR
jgi:hypothetical protein